MNSEATKACLSGEVQERQLIPGIPDELTLEQIATRMSWTDICRMASVSSGWRHEIESRQVYGARLRSHSTETFVFLNGDYTETRDGIALYSLKEDRSLDLPPIPNCERGFPGGCDCVTFDGKLYVIGGATDISERMGSEKVFVLDLAGEKKWKQCANMGLPRREHGCGLLDGKIYAIGGHHLGLPVFGSEVYDTREDIWSPIKPMASLRVAHDVTRLGDKLLVHGGACFDSKRYDSVGNPIPDDEDPDAHKYTRCATSEEIYNPRTDEWSSKVLKPFVRASRQVIFMSDGKPHLFSWEGIYAQNVDEKSWVLLHMCDFSEIQPVYNSQYFGRCFPCITPLSILALGDELLAAVFWDDQESGVLVGCLVRSTGFRTKSRLVTWKRAHHSFDAGVQRDFLMDIRL